MLHQHDIDITSDGDLREIHVIANSDNSYNDLSPFELYEAFRTSLHFGSPDMEVILLTLEEAIETLFEDHNDIEKAKRKRLYTHIIRRINVLEMKDKISEVKFKEINDQLTKAKQVLLVSLKDDLMLALFPSIPRLPNELWLQIITHLSIHTANRLAKVSHLLRRLVFEDKRKRKAIKDSKDYTMPMLHCAPAKANGYEYWKKTGHALQEAESLITLNDDNDMVAYINFFNKVIIGRFHGHLFKELTVFKVIDEKPYSLLPDLVRLPGTQQFATHSAIINFDKHIAGKTLEHSESIIRIWKPEFDNYIQQAEVRLPHGVKKFAVTAQGSMIAYISQDNPQTVFFWDIDKNACVGATSGEDVLATSTGNIITVHVETTASPIVPHNSIVHIWDSEGKEINHFTYKYRAATKIAEVKNKLLMLDSKNGYLFSFNLNGHSDKQVYWKFKSNEAQLCPRRDINEDWWRNYECIMPLNNEKVAIMIAGDITIVDLTLQEVFFSTVDMSEKEFKLACVINICMNDEGNIILVCSDYKGLYACRELRFYDSQSLHSDSQIVRDPSFMRAAVATKCINLIKYALNNGTSPQVDVRENLSALNYSFFHCQFHIVEYLAAQGAGLSAQIECPSEVRKYIDSKHLKNCLFLDASWNGVPISRRMKRFEYAITNLEELKEAILKGEVDCVKVRNMLLANNASKFADAIKLVTSLAQRVNLKAHCLFFAVDHLPKEMLYNHKVTDELKEEIKQTIPWISR